VYQGAAVPAPSAFGIHPHPTDVKPAGRFDTRSAQITTPQSIRAEWAARAPTASVDLLMILLLNIT